MINYRNIIKSRDLRLKILDWLSWVPDSMMLRFQYYIQLGRRLNLKHPRRYTEKIQYYKIHYKNPLLIPCVDKYDVREYVRDCGLDYILNELYGIYEHADEVDFKRLPDEFVCKDTLGGGSNGVVVVKSKSKYDIPKLKKQMETWVTKDVHIKGGGREWPYYAGKHCRILIEKLLKTDDPKGLKDYKFFCFQGKAEFLYVSQGLDQIETASISFLDMNWQMLPFRRMDFPPFPSLPEKPSNFDEMKQVAERLAKDFPHVRVDLYNLDGRIVFGELTFYNSSGYMRFEPDEYDFIVGNMFDLSSIR